MSLNINFEKLEALQNDLQNIKDNTSNTYGEISDLSNTISGNWSSTGSEAFINKYNTLAKRFDDYNVALNSINNYINNTKEEYITMKEKVQETIDT
jgi:WXG100 family type VII secretion target